MGRRKTWQVHSVTVSRRQTPSNTESMCSGDKLSVEKKRLKSIKNRDQDIPDVRMAAEQVRSSLFPAKSRLCCGVKSLKHHLRFRLHLLVAYGFRLIQGVSHNIKH
jgi:hypothetical protein